MNDAILIALSKLTTTNAKNARLSVGSHSVKTTLTLEIDAVVNKGADYSKTPTHKVPKIALLAACLQYMGATREAALKNLTAAISEAIENGDKAACYVESIADISKTEKTVVAALESLPKTVCNGATTIKGTAKIVDSDLVTAILATTL